MADLGNMELSVSADLSGLTSGLDKGIVKIKAFGAEAVKISTAASNADAGFKKMTGGANQAANALQNIGRVAQDLPFGFIGIQNNLNPLLESFQRLKAETGTTGGALKALAASLVGAGGVGLALSLVSSAILIFQNGIAGFNSKTKEAADSTKKYKDELNGIFSEVSKEAANVSSLIAVLQSETETRERKLSVIKELNKINPEIFNGLKLEASAVTGVNIAYKAYLDNLKNIVTSKILQQKLDKELNKLVELEGAARTKSEKGNRALLDFYSDLGEGTKKAATRTGQLAINFAQSLDPITATKGRIDELIASLSEFSKTVVVPKTHEKKDIETVSDVLEKLGREIDLLNQKKIDIGIDQSSEKISAISSAINTLVEKFKVDPKGTIIQKLFGDIKDINLSLLQAELQKTINNIHLRTSAEILFDAIQAQRELSTTLGKHPMKAKAQIEFEISNSNSENDRTAILEKLKSLGITSGLQIGINASIEQLDTAALSKLLSKAEGELEKFRDIVANTMIDVFTSIGDSIGGKGNFFQGIFQAIGSGLRTLGIYLLGASKLILSIKAKLATVPHLALIGSIALIALGTALQAAAPQAFAVGTQNFRGGLALVGERGPELVNLPTGAGVIPNEKIAGIQGAGPQIIVLETMVRGQDLVFLQSRVNKANGRSF